MEKGLMKILVVDDELLICEFLDEFLSQKGYQVITVTDGEEAIKRFEKDKPHIVLLDIKMPGVSGIEVLHRIKEIDTKTVVIILTAIVDPDIVQNIQKMGVNDYLVKPIDLECLEKILISWQKRFISQ
jgi:DNA-binding response OmpR family regulator